LSYISLKTY